jgi:hypothetical protein
MNGFLCLPAKKQLWAASLCHLPTVRQAHFIGIPLFIFYYVSLKAISIIFLHFAAKILLATKARIGVKVTFRNIILKPILACLLTKPLTGLKAAVRVCRPFFKLKRIWSNPNSGFQPCWRLNRESKKVMTKFIFL